MNLEIRQNKLSDEIKRKIFQGFARQAITSTGIDGLNEDPISFEVVNGSEFVGAIVVQLFWNQLHIKYLFVEENYRGQGLARQLMDHALEFGKKRGCQFAFVETMSFQAPDFYQKMGFVIEFSRPGYAENTTFHYLKKSLDKTFAPKKITRTGVYGVVVDEGKLLVIRQKRGPYAGKFDLPGGGIEFGESAEQTLRREFVEEVAMEFDSMQLIDNLTATIDVPSTPSNEPYVFHQIGMIYRVNGCRVIKDEQQGDLQHVWIEPEVLSHEKCSLLLWKFLKSNALILSNKEIHFIPFDEQSHDIAGIKKLLSTSVYAAEEEKLNRILKTYSSAEQGLFLYFFDQKLIGLIGFDLGGKILHIAVDQAFRFKGIAREMINRISTKFSILKAETDNEGVGFYKACGFKIESLGELYPGKERFKCTKQVGKI